MCVKRVGQCVLSFDRFRVPFFGPSTPIRSNRVARFSIDDCDDSGTENSHLRFDVRYSILGADVPIKRYAQLSRQGVSQNVANVG